MNSVLQCLSNTRALLEYVITDEYASHLNTTTSSMNGALIKGKLRLIGFWGTIANQEVDSVLFF